MTVRFYVTPIAETHHNPGKKTSEISLDLHPDLTTLDEAVRRAVEKVNLHQAQHKAWLWERRGVKTIINGKIIKQDSGMFSKSLREVDDKYDIGWFDRDENQGKKEKRLYLVHCSGSVGKKKFISRWEGASPAAPDFSTTNVWREPKGRGLPRRLSADSVQINSAMANGLYVKRDVVAMLREDELKGATSSSDERKGPTNGPFRSSEEERKGASEVSCPTVADEEAAAARYARYATAKLEKFSVGLNVTTKRKEPSSAGQINGHGKKKASTGRGAGGANAKAQPSSSHVTPPVSQDTSFLRFKTIHKISQFLVGESLVNTDPQKRLELWELDSDALGKFVVGGPLPQWLITTGSAPGSAPESSSAAGGSRSSSTKNSAGGEEKYFMALRELDLVEDVGGFENCAPSAGAQGDRMACMFTNLVGLFFSNSHLEQTRSSIKGHVFHCLRTVVVARG